MKAEKEASKADEHIRISAITKKKLDKIAPCLAEQLEKKDVSYDEVVSFLADQFEEPTNES